MKPQHIEASSLQQLRPTQFVSIKEYVCLDCEVVTHPAIPNKSESKCPTVSKRFLGDDICDDDTNTYECSYDGGDCCDPKSIFDHCSQCLCKSGQEKVKGTINATTQGHGFTNQSYGLGTTEATLTLAAIELSVLTTPVENVGIFKHDIM